MRHTIEQNNTLIIRGPASLQLVDGYTEVFGAPLARNRLLVVGREKQLAVEARSPAALDVFLGNTGSTYEVKGSTIPASWESTAEALIEMQQGKVMVVGMTDVGKSTLCTYLTNRLLLQGLRLTVVDGDVGQSDIGPPTTVGSSIPTTSVTSLGDLEPGATVFIGHTSPNKVEDRIINALIRLSNPDIESLTIVNTDGWILDPEAISYKIRMIAATKPDLVVGLANGTELQPILSGSRARSLRVGTAKAVLERSRSDRREIRTVNYRRFLEGGKIRTVSLRDVNISTPRGLPRVDEPRAWELSNLVVGLLNGDGYMIQIGILIDVGDQTARIYSRPAESVRRIEVGYVKLSTAGTELGYFED